MEREAVVSFRDVDFSYNSVPVLEDVSFTIYDKSFISIVGPNAGGKTTLLKLMLGLLGPSRGTIEIFMLRHIADEGARPDRLYAAACPV